METTSPGPDAPATPVLFRAEMRPHRSLSPLGFWILMGAISGVSFTVGLLFLLAGAWPIFGFLGLDVLLIYVFFRLNYRQARAYETLTLTEEALILHKVSAKGAVHAHRFEPYWLRVEMGAGREENRLTLASHGKRVEIGAFLTPDEKTGLAEEIRSALRRREAMMRFATS